MGSARYAERYDGGTPRYETPPEKRAIDIERLLHWAFAGERVGGLWRESADLAFDRGLTARPRHREDGDWKRAAICAGIAHGNAPRIRLACTPCPDARIVLEAVRALTPIEQRLVVACASGGIRPDWMPGADPRLMPIWRDRVRRIPKILGRDRNRHYGYCPLAWSLDPEAIRAARERYTVWHQAVAILRIRLAGRLNSFRIGGFEANPHPWKNSR